MKDHSETDCQTVLTKYENSTKDDENSASEYGVLVLAQTDYKDCEMTDCGDLCDGCSIRIYHNYIDEDEFFKNSEVSDISKTSEII